MGLKTAAWLPALIHSKDVIYHGGCYVHIYVWGCLMGHLGPFRCVLLALCTAKVGSSPCPQVFGRKGMCGLSRGDFPVHRPAFFVIPWAQAD